MAETNKSLHARRNFNIWDNRSIFLVVLIFLAIGINSCCTDMYCHGAHDMGKIELLNFSEYDVDSTFLIFYEKDTDFKIVEDSILVDISVVSSNMFYGYSTRIISIDYDYQVCFTAIKKTYEISGFRTSKAECNECFPRKDYYTKVDGYEINGIYKEYSTIQIDLILD